MTYLLNVDDNDHNIDNNDNNNDSGEPGKME